MTVMFTFQVLTAVALVAIAAFEIRQMARHRDDQALRVLVPGVVCLATVVTLGIPVPAFEPVDDFLATFEFSNIAWMFMAYCFAAFFLLADHRRSQSARRRRARIELAVFVLAVTTMLVVATMSPPEIWDRPRSPEDYRSWWNIAFYLTVDGYGLGAWMLGVARGLGYLRRLEHRWARLALGVAVAGSAGMVLGVNGVSLVRQGVYLVFPGSTWPTLRTVYNTGRLGGQILLAVGLALAPLATRLSWVRDRRDRLLRARYRRRVGRLWQVLAAEFPQVVLRPGHGVSRSSAAAASSG